MNAVIAAAILVVFALGAAAWSAWKGRRLRDRARELERYYDASSSAPTSPDEAAARLRDRRPW